MVSGRGNLRLEGAFLGVFLLAKCIVQCLVFILQEADAIALVVVLVLLAVDLVLLALALLVKLILFIVVFVLQRQEVFIERNAVAQQRLVTGGLVFLVNLTILQLLNLQLHRGDLLLEVVDELDVEVLADLGVLRARLE